MDKKNPILYFLTSSLLIFLTSSAMAQTPILDELGRETGLINMNPDPDGEPWISGGLSPLSKEDIEAYNQIPDFEIPEHLRGRRLPKTVDHSIEPEFRPIFNQKGGSCGQASGMGYHFTYERNLALGTKPVTKDNICAYGFTWNFVNGGSGTGSWPSSGYGIAEKMGCGHTADFKGQDNGGSATAWMDGYKGYYNGNDCHVVEQVKFTTKDVEKLKNWFYDKGTGTGKNGGCVTFGASVSFSIKTISSGPFEGQKLATSLKNGSAHAMTLAGYSDEVSYDLNGDGRITNDIDITRDGVVDLKDQEKGAWLLVNSWGSSWNNKGKVWVLCSGFGAQNILGIKVKPVKTKFMIKATITHKSRSGLVLKGGFSPDVNATAPTKTMTYGKAFNKAGGKHPLAGKQANSKLEIGLDVSSFFTEEMREGTFFIQANSTSGTINSVSLMDYTSGSPKEIKSTQSNVSISGTVNIGIPLKFATAVSKKQHNHAKEFSGGMVVHSNPVELGKNSFVELSINGLSNRRIEGTAFIYDALGNTINTLPLTGGMKKLSWNLRNEQGKRVGPGTYLAAFVPSISSRSDLPILKTFIGVKE